MLMFKWFWTVFSLGAPEGLAKTIKCFKLTPNFHEPVQETNSLTGFWWVFSSEGSLDSLQTRQTGGSNLILILGWITFELLLLELFHFVFCVGCGNFVVCYGCAIMTFFNSSCFNFHQVFLQNFEEKTELILFLVVPHEEKGFKKVV